MAAIVDGPMANGQPAQSGPFTQIESVPQSKRKREDGVEQSEEQLPFEQLQRDLLSVLEPLDTQPSFLKYQQAENKQNGPSPKKARTSDGSDSEYTSIFTKLDTAAYSTLDAVKEDISRVGEEMADTIRAQNEESENKRTNLDTLQKLQQVQKFRSLAVDLLDNEEGFPSKKKAPIKQVDARATTSDATFGIDGLGSVLTLFGNAPTPKQLFSSMQTSINPRHSGPMSAPLAVEEMGLPIGISVTKVFPATTAKSSHGPTFAETFPPPRTLPTLLPPKTQRRPSTRDGTVTWEFNDRVGRNHRKGGWTVQSQTTGSWLSYNGVVPSRITDSPREKRKQRDRALSGGESVQLLPDMSALTEAASNEEQALFRRAYSTFAPSHDNSKALIPAEVKSMMWWQNVGQDRFRETFAVDPALLDESLTEPLSLSDNETALDPDLDALVDAIERYEEDDSLSFRRMEDVPSTIQRISELLETLASHQRIRHATLPSSAATTRTPISPAPVLAAKIGLPHAPAEEEISTYERVKHDLAHLLLKLPPYAIAKLDGDKFAELGVSALLSFQTPNIKGTLEEDLPSRIAKYSASVAASANASHHRSSSSSSQHYSATAQRTPAIGQAANTRYGQQYGGGRTPATAHSQYPRTPSHGQVGTPTMTSRPGFSHPSQHSRPGINHQSYNQQYSNSRPQSYSTANGYGNSHQPALPNTRPNYALSRTPSHHQQRSQAMTQSAVGYSPSSTPLNNRTSSPVKPMDYMQQAIVGKAGYGVQAQHLSTSEQSTPSKPVANYSPQPHAIANGGHLPPGSTTVQRPLTNGH